MANCRCRNYVVCDLVRTALVTRRIPDQNPAVPVIREREVRRVREVKRRIDRVGRVVREGQHALGKGRRRIGKADVCQIDHVTLGKPADGRRERVRAWERQAQRPGVVEEAQGLSR